MSQGVLVWFWLGIDVVFLCNAEFSRSIGCLPAILKLNGFVIDPFLFAMRYQINVAHNLLHSWPAIRMLGALHCFLYFIVNIWPSLHKKPGALGHPGWCYLWREKFFKVDCAFIAGCFAAMNELGGKVYYSISEQIETINFLTANSLVWGERGHA